MRPTVAGARRGRPRPNAIHSPERHPRGPLGRGTGGQDPELEVGVDPPGAVAGRVDGGDSDGTFDHECVAAAGEDSYVAPARDGTLLTHRRSDSLDMR